MALLAQHGYGKGNKIHEGIVNGYISGVVLSPKSESPEKLSVLAEEVLKISKDYKVFFDPQFYLANMQGEISIGKLPDYPYFENSISRAKLSNPELLSSYIKRVIDFESELNVTSYISPTIIIPSFDSVNCQIAISMAYACIPLVNEKEIYISFCIAEKAFLNKDSMEEFLDIISLLDVDGFYFIIDKENNTEKTTLYDIEALPNIMKFVYNLSIINQFKIIMGYSDIISLLFASISNADFSTGWYMNLKQFSSNNFVPKTGGRRPRKRYTSTKLLGSLLLSPELHTLNQMGITQELLSNSAYDSLIFPSVRSDEWTDEISCLSNWNVLNSAIIELSEKKNIDERLDLLIKKIIDAQKTYKDIYAKIPLLDSKSNDSHLNRWYDAIMIFRKDVGV